MSRVSVIIPALDEELRIEASLAAVSALGGAHEIIVVDGGSSDRTCELVRRHAEVRFLRESPGRGVQMNAGARIASGDVLLFLHVDVALPADALEWIERALAEDSVVAGAFRTWTVADRGRSWLSPFLHLADLRSRYSGLPYGDQAMFVRAEVFRDLGGFAELPLMEDLELSRRLRGRGKIRTVPAVVQVSGRRFLERPLYYLLVVNTLPLFYRLGVPPGLLKRLYANVR